MWDTILPILIEQALLPLVSAIITAAIAWAAARFHQWTGMQIEARHREALQSALENGARYALELLAEQGALLDLRDPALLQRVMDDAIGYVTGSVPDAVRHFGLSIPMLEQLLRPKIPVLTEQQARDLTGYTGPIENRSSRR